MNISAFLLIVKDNLCKNINKIYSILNINYSINTFPTGLFFTNQATGGGAFFSPPMYFFTSPS